LYGYSQDSQLYKRSKAGVVQLWAELKSLGLDMTFLLDALIDEGSAGACERAFSLEPISAVEGVKG
jgi:hypothetical protein